MADPNTCSGPYTPAMPRGLSLRILTTWIAAWAVLMSALAPAISHALAQDGEAPWVEVCTSSGSKWVDPSTGEEAPAPGDGPATGPCGYCVLHVDAAAFGPDSPRVPVTGTAHHVADAFLSAPRVAHAWRAPHSRAPPSLG